MNNMITDGMNDMITDGPENNKKDVEGNLKNLFVTGSVDQARLAQ